MPPELDKFTEGYIDCMLWLVVARADDGAKDREYDRDDVPEDAWAEIIDDCANFQEAQEDILHEQEDERNGHDFFLTRNGHGAGFWDRGIVHGDELAEAACIYGMQDLYETGVEDAPLHLGS